MQLLVAGADRVDAGKTTFSTGLVHETGATGYKPRAGNDYWFDHDDCRRAVDAGRLYGKDARQLAEASPGEPDPETVNPVHRLWAPVPGPRKGLLGQGNREVLVDRVGARGDERWVINATADLPPSFRESLPLADAVEVSSIAEFNDVMCELHVPAVAALAERITAAEHAVVESYADVARPLTGVEPDAVAVVEPRRARFYDGERYGNACDVASGSARTGRLEETVRDVLDLLEPRMRVELPALSRRQRTDPAVVAAEYAPAYEALLTVAND